MHPTTIKFFAGICLCLLITTAAFSQNADAKLVELRKQFAINYLKPEAHFAVAKYYLEKGNKLQAFFLLEYARRYRFEEKDFNPSFKKFFGENSAEPSAEAKAAFEKAYDFLKQNKLDEAEKSFLTAASLAPKSALIQTWVGRFFYKAKPNNTQALKYYFNAYFLDPDSYETEFVESRIRSISIADAESRFAELVKNGKSLIEISTDENPLIVSKAIEQMAQQWKSEYTNALLENLTNDDDSIRWLALTTIFENVGTSSDKLISALLNNTDMRKRGLAAYAVIKFQKEKGFGILKQMLASEAELVRFDAVSALALDGGETGLEILRTHRKVEANLRLQQLIDIRLQEK